MKPKRKPRKVVVFVAIAGDTGDVIGYSENRKSAAAWLEYPDDRVVRCEGVLK